MADTVGNIVEQIRKESSITQKRLAELSGLSVLYIIRAEQGMSQALPSNLLGVLSNLSGSDTKEIQETYIFQRAAMVAYYLKKVHDNPKNDEFITEAIGWALDNYTPKVGSAVGVKLSHPLYLFRTRFCQLHGLPTSAIKFCQMFGMHPATISEIEKRENTLEKDSVVYQKVQALGVLDYQLDMLCKACDSCL